MNRYFIRVDFSGYPIGGPVVADYAWPSTAVGTWIELDGKRVPGERWNAESEAWE